MRQLMSDATRRLAARAVVRRLCRALAIVRRLVSGSEPCSLEAICCSSLLLQPWLHRRSVGANGRSCTVPSRDSGPRRERRARRRVAAASPSSSAITKGVREESAGALLARRWRRREEAPTHKERASSYGTVRCREKGGVGSGTYFRASRVAASLGRRPRREP